MAQAASPMPITPVDRTTIAKQVGDAIAKQPVTDMHTHCFAPSFGATFVARAPEAQPTYVIGPSHEHRAAFAARGLILLQDAKGLRIPKTVAAREQVLESAPPQPGPVRCENGKAGLYPCDGVDFFARVALHQFSSNPSAANDIWGFVDLNDGKEYAIIGVHNG